MNDENNRPPDDNTTDAAPLPQSNGHSNGVTTEIESAMKDADLVVRKRKKKKKGGQAAAATSVGVVAIVDQTATPPGNGTVPEIMNASLTGPEQPTPIMEPTVEPTSTEPAPMPYEEPIAQPVASSRPIGLRLRMKIWTDHETGKRYVVPTAFWQDLDGRGQPRSDVMWAYAIGEDDTRRIILRAHEWQALPLHQIQENCPT